MEHNLPPSVNDHVALRKMFPKGEDAKHYVCDRMKTTAIIAEMAAEAQGAMGESLKHCIFALAVDGSNDASSHLHLVWAAWRNAGGFKANPCKHFKDRLLATKLAASCSAHCVRLIYLRRIAFHLALVIQSNARKEKWRGCCFKGSTRKFHCT